MTNKQNIRHFWHYYGGIVGLIFVLSYSVWYFGLSLWHAPHPDERLGIFVETPILRDLTLEVDIKTALKSAGLKEMDIYAFDPSDPQITTKYDQFGQTSDILILRGQDLDDMASTIGDTLFTISPTLKENLLATYQWPLDDFDYENLSYGLKIFSATDAAYNSRYQFADFCDFSLNTPGNNDYYLVFNRHSVNLDPNSSTLAIQAAQFLFNRYQ